MSHEIILFRYKREDESLTSPRDFQAPWSALVDRVTSDSTTQQKLNTSNKNISIFILKLTPLQV